MSSKFCMECGGELFFAATGTTAMCPKCGRTYTFSEAPAAESASLSAGGGKEKCAALFRLGDTAAAIEQAEVYLKNAPQDFRAHLLRASLEVGMYTMDPVDAVIDRHFGDYSQYVARARRVASVEEQAEIERETSKFVSECEEVCELFREIAERRSGKRREAPKKPEAPTQSELLRIDGEINACRERVAEAGRRLEAARSDDTAERLSQTPIPKLIGRQRRLEELSREIAAANRAKEKNISEAQAALDAAREKLRAALEARDAEEARLEGAYAEYPEACRRYESEMAEYNAYLDGYDARTQYLEANRTAMRIKERLDGIEREIAELEARIEKNRSQSTDFVFTGKMTSGPGGLADYYLAQSAHRTRESALTSERIRLGGEISELKLKLLPPKAREESKIEV